MTKKSVPVACNLDTDGRQSQLQRWLALQPSCTRVEKRDDHVVLWFEAQAGNAVRAAVAVEQSCCGFLTLDVTQDQSEARLTLGTQPSDGWPVVQALAELAGGDLYVRSRSAAGQ
ncbi:MAG TPA: hypothetical protein VFH58_12550 [Acidimicrobiales bacterium]|nr:hypothetical protein [Acidimicrobiales bacterium]